MSVNSKKIVIREQWDPLATWIHNFFCNSRNSPMFQVIFGFTFGMLLSPWSNGIFWLAIITIIYEIFFYMFTNGDPRYYNLFVRTAVIYSNILGYICGRTLTDSEITYCKIPSFCDEPDCICPL